MKRIALLVVCVALFASSGCCWWGRPMTPYGAGYGGGCPGGACGASPYGAAPGYQQGAFVPGYGGQTAYAPYGAPVTAAVPMDYVIQ
ncbi:MAG: hypothetical protein KDA69_08745 [Planctomycetaceae bacterium]|nr:hypothetical protein [Planctomycetaceae bacterium]MCA9029534.1 hypothetical protein [Planctomycetaceae bacterium]MCA9044394.1 hypothetical protein [Planctomycetaceae bacterium]MCB9950824.1 hypothetical protein [Planctomycetaceae bacterium]